MPRFRMTVEYDGTPYYGWQRQENGPSVQGALEAAVRSLTGESASIRGAGRTDSACMPLGRLSMSISRETGSPTSYAMPSMRISPWRVKRWPCSMPLP